MENQRLFIFIALVFLGMVLYQEWEREYGVDGVKVQPQTSVQQNAVPTTSAPASIPAANTSSPNDVPDVSQVTTTRKPTKSGESNKLDSSGRVIVRTDFLDVILDKTGGDIRQVDLKQYPVSQDKPDEAFRFMTDKGAKLYVAQSGFAMSQGAGPSHKAVFSTEKDTYALEEGKDDLQVVMNWFDESGVKVTKTYTFHRSSHIIDIDTQVDNASAASWQGSFYRQQQRTQFGQESPPM